MDLSVLGGAETVRVALPLRPSMVAVIVVEPAASAVAMPEEVIFATVGPASVQVADAVTSWEEPSLKVADALNCFVAPTERLAVAGDAAIAIRFFCEGGDDAVPPQPMLASSSAKVSEQKNELTNL
jgi:hypothetical protein